MKKVIISVDTTVSEDWLKRIHGHGYDFDQIYIYPYWPRETRRDVVKDVTNPIYSDERGSTTNDTSV